MLWTSQKYSIPFLFINKNEANISSDFWLVLKNGGAVLRNEEVSGALKTVLTLLQDDWGEEWQRALTERICTGEDSNHVEITTA